jgi:SAM-dependent methyltransferase
LVDLVPASFVPGERAVIASLLELPFRHGLYDLVVCVGSVVNYVDAVRAVSELCRVLKPGGTLIVEYERAWALPWKDKLMVEPESVIYRGVPHTLNLYHDDYIQQILLSEGMKIRRRLAYHALSAVIEFLTRNAADAELYRTMDNVAGKFLSGIAANAIVECVANG